MSVITLEAVAEGAIVRLPDHVELPPGTRCFVVVPDAPEQNVPRAGGSRLVDSSRQADFHLEVIDLATKERH